MWVVFLKVEAHCQSSVLCTSLFCVVKCSSLQGTPYAPSKNPHLGILNNSLCYLLHPIADVSAFLLKTTESGGRIGQNCKLAYVIYNPVGL